MIHISRDSIPEITSVDVDGEEYSLGLLKDLRKHPALSGLIPEGGRIAISWVRLRPGERLPPHRHPIESLIVIAHGNGRTEGDLNACFSDGDIIFVPSNSLHGFVGAEPSGYWALSIQFEERGLYEDRQRPQARFEARTPLDELIQRNEKHMSEHRSNRIFELLLDPRLREERHRSRLLDCIQVWSDYFQRLVLLRSALTESADHAPLAQAHLSEEFGHNLRLAKDRGSKLKRVWDPVLDSTASWFSWKMLTSSPLERVVLVHLVLEGGSTVFHQMAHPIMKSYQETEHFGIHDGADEQHMAMGLELLRTQSSRIDEGVFELLEEGWSVLNKMCDRMAEITLA